MPTRTRIVAVVVGLAGVAAIVGGSVFAAGLTAEASTEEAALTPIWRTAEVDPNVPAFPAVPTADTLPASFSDAERAAALIWLDQHAIVTQCMIDAGFTEFHVGALWQPGLPEYPAIAWQEGLSDEEKARSATTWFGERNGSGSDYDWKLGGCDGYAWHMVGVDYPY